MSKLVKAKDLKPDDRVQRGSLIFCVGRVTTTDDSTTIQWYAQGRPFTRSGSSETLMEVL